MDRARKVVAKKFDSDEEFEIELSITEVIMPDKHWYIGYVRDTEALATGFNRNPRYANIG